MRERDDTFVNMKFDQQNKQLSSGAILAKLRSLIAYTPRSLVQLKNVTHLGDIFLAQLLLLFMEQFLYDRAKNMCYK